jgi:predicted nucleic acid-binding protein
MLADTSALIGLLRGDVEAEEIENHGKIATCYPVQCELFKGTRIARNTEKGEKQVEKLLDRIGGLEADREAARNFSELKQKYPEISELDLMIAGICLSHGASLMTRDEDFKEIDEVEIIFI